VSEAIEPTVIPSGEPALSSERRARLKGALLVSIVAALLVFPPLGSQGISTSDEARFVLLARDMLERDAWFGAEVRGKLYRNKPPLYPWSVAALSRLTGGLTEATAQAPVAAAAVVGVLFTFLLGERLFGLRGGLWAGLVLATSYHFFTHSQKFLPDMLVAAFAAVAGYAFWRAVREPPGRGALVAFYAALALGMFAKGPVGLLPVLTVAVWLWGERGVRGLPTLWSPLGVSVFAAITLAWLGPFLALGTGSFARNVLWTNWLDWYLGLPVPSRLANLVSDALVGFAPWTLVAPLAFVCAYRAWRADPAVRFAVLWFAVPLFAVMLSAGQRTRYLVPVYPGAALVVAWWADARGSARTAAGRALAWAALAGAVGAIAWLVAAPPFGLSLTSWQLVPLIAGAGLLGGALFTGLLAARPALLIQGGAIAMMLILGSGIWVHNAWVNRTESYKDLAELVRRNVGDTEVAVFGARFFPLDFYLGRDLHRIWSLEEFDAYLARPDRPAVVAVLSAWRMIEGRTADNVRVLDWMDVGDEEMLIIRARPPGAPGTRPPPAGEPWAQAPR